MRHTSYIDTVSDESLYCVMWFKNLISLLISSHFHDGHHEIIEFSHVNLFVIIGIPFFKGKIFCLDKYHRLYYPYFTEYKVPHMQDETYHMPGKRTSARVNFGTRTSAPISKNFINFGTSH